MHRLKHGVNLPSRLARGHARVGPRFVDLPYIEHGVIGENVEFSIGTSNEGDIVAELLRDGVVIDSNMPPTGILELVENGLGKTYQLRSTITNARGNETVEYSNALLVRDATPEVIDILPNVSFYYTQSGNIAGDIVRAAFSGTNLTYTLSSNTPSFVTIDDEQNIAIIQPNVTSFTFSVIASNSEGSVSVPVDVEVLAPELESPGKIIVVDSTGSEESFSFVPAVFNVGTPQIQVLYNGEDITNQLIDNQVTVARLEINAPLVLRTYIDDVVNDFVEYEVISTTPIIVVTPPSISSLIEGDDVIAASNDGEYTHPSGAPVVIVRRWSVNSEEFTADPGQAMATSSYQYRVTVEAPDGTRLDITSDAQIAGYLPVTANDDTATVTAGQTIDVDVLANDEGSNLEISEIGGDYAAYASIVTTGEGQRIRFTTTLAA